MKSNLKKIRESRNLRQKEIAAMLEMPVRTYGSYERGEREMPLDEAARIADVYNITLDELMGRDFRGAHEAEIDASETELIKLFRSMTGSKQVALLSVAREFVR